ncbi:MAG: hypothetical protein ACQRW7_01825 [Caulobacterales bacterium]|uniref:hypothetical protein n=1 Tax=Glycocaulis sp. TaxID=1969725 RepID=UPI003FA0EB17
MGQVWKGDVRRSTQCTSCGTGYYYFDLVEVREDDPVRFESAMRRAIDFGTDLVPCPRCGKASATMWADWRKKVVKKFAIGIGMLIGFAVVMAIAMNGAPFFYILAIILPLAGLGYLIWGAVMLLKPVTNKRAGIVPGEEASAPPSVQARIAAFDKGE